MAFLSPALPVFATRAHVHFAWEVPEPGAASDQEFVPSEIVARLEPEQ